MSNTLERFLCTAMLTPIVSPGEHPSDPHILWGIPINLVGLSGIAKTKRIEQLGKMLGINVYPVYAGTKQPTDFAGALVPTPNGVLIECVLPQAKKCIDHGGGIIHLDEISCARPATQAALLSFVAERRVGDHVLPPKTRILLSMNPPKYAAGGFALEPPMANRMGHHPYPVLDKMDWSNWLIGVKPEVFTIEEGEKIVEEKWNEHWPSVVGLARGFVSVGKSELFHEQPEPDDPASGGAWPSYRMWHWFLCALTTIRCLDAPESLEVDFGNALLGKGPTNEFLTWKKSMDLPHPRIIMSGKWTPEKRRLDRTITCLTAMVEFLSSIQDKREATSLAPGAWEAIAKTTEVSLDIVYPITKKMLALGYGRTNTNPAISKAAECVIMTLSNSGMLSL